jgi:hypothetical protein
MSWFNGCRNVAQGLRKAERTHVFRVFTGLATSNPSMVPPFDIFKKQPGGSARWLEVVADLEAAKLRVKDLEECVPGEYFIFSLATGRRLDVKRDEVGVSTDPPKCE